MINVNKQVEVGLDNNEVRFVEEDIIDEEGELAIVTKNPVSEIKEIVPLPQMMEMAETLSKSTIVPVEYQNRPENVLLALDMSNRMGISPLVIMQQMYIVRGKPSFSGQFIAQIVQNSPRFEDVELVYVGEKGTDSYGAYVRAIDKKTGNELRGTTITIGMAKAEKWGNKWGTMPTQMLGYRAYSYFGRLYAPAELMGMYANDELEDIQTNNNQANNPYRK